VDPRQAIAHGPMGRFQWSAIALCLVVNMLDGFDVLAMAFTAPAIARAWGVAPEALGWLYSSGLVGMMLGSLVLAPLADRIGRRPIIVLCLVVVGAGMAASALAGTVAQLATTRVLTGVGIGGALASLNTIVAEYASVRWRSFAVSLLQTGYPIGATIGGGLAAGLLEASGWRAVFAFGALGSVVLVPIVLWRLPESVDYLLSRRPPDALARVNALLARLGQPPLAALPAAPAIAPEAPRVGRLFAASFRPATWRLWTAFFMVMASFYFALSWTPKLLVDAGLSLEAGVSGGVLMNLGGIAGAGWLGWRSSQGGLHRLLAGYMAACAVALGLFGALGDRLQPLLVLAPVIGFFVFGSMVGLYAMAPGVYPAEIRTTGIGWAIGVGRAGGVVGPYAAGVLLAGGWSHGSCYVLFALPLVAALAMVLSMPAPGTSRPAGT
jgi:benzoate transport